MIGSVWSVNWNNPYTNPPEGQPRVLAERFYPMGHACLRNSPPELDAMRRPGYAIYWAAVNSLPRQLSQDKLAVTRQKRLRRRMEQKYPLFADWMIEQELLKKPSFYAGITDKRIQDDQDAAVELQRQRLIRLITDYNEREPGNALQLDLLVNGRS
jgi:hypothetical protein